MATSGVSILVDISENVKEEHRAFQQSVSS